MCLYYPLLFLSLLSSVPLVEFAFYPCWNILPLGKVTEQVFTESSDLHQVSPLVLCLADTLALVGVFVISEWKKYLGELELYARDKDVNNNLLPRNRILGYVIMKELWSLKMCKLWKITGKNKITLNTSP